MCFILQIQYHYCNAPPFQHDDDDDEEDDEDDGKLCDKILRKISRVSSL
jgi:hypothetical protein